MGSMVGDSAWVAWVGLGLLVVIGNVVWWARKRRQTQKNLEQRTEVLVKNEDRQNVENTSVGAEKSGTN